MRLKYVLFALFMATFVVSIHSQSFTGKPKYQIAIKRNGASLGIIHVELFPKIAPGHVRNFDSLVNIHFFDSTAFHRVIPGFMIQGGDPNSRHGAKSTWGYGDPSQATVDAEFSAAKHLRGILSAARAQDTNSATSQFFICVTPAATLNGKYSVYGRATAGMDVVDTIVSAPRDASDNPFSKIEMYITADGSNDSIPLTPTLTLPTNGAQNVGKTQVLKWTVADDAIIYHVQVATDASFSNILYEGNVSGATVTVKNLHTTTTYYWRVAANNGGNISPYSETWTFNTNIGAGISTDNFHSPDVTPNPTTDIVTFNGLTDTDYIEIYNLEGRLLLREYPKNSFSQLDLSAFSKGIYIYQIMNPSMRGIQGKLVVQ
jgi:peptidyl-prolyl cis-trans isomerase B (cyclophilin B)